MILDKKQKRTQIMEFFLKINKYEKINFFYIFRLKS